MDTIQAVIATLNKIEVHGKENLDMLLGCIMLLERINAAESKAAENVEEETSDG